MHVIGAAGIVLAIVGFFSGVAEERRESRPRVRAEEATVSVPANLSLRLADGGDGIAFLPDGRASDAVVVLSEARQGYGVRVNGLSGAVDIVRTRP